MCVRAAGTGEMKLSPAGFPNNINENRIWIEDHLCRKITRNVKCNQNRVSQSFVEKHISMCVHDSEVIQMLYCGAICLR